MNVRGMCACSSGLGLIMEEEVPFESAEAIRRRFAVRVPPAHV